MREQQMTTDLQLGVSTLCLRVLDEHHRAMPMACSGAETLNSPPQGAGDVLEAERDGWLRDVPQQQQVAVGLSAAIGTRTHARTHARGIA